MGQRGRGKSRKMFVRDQMGQRKSQKRDQKDQTKSQKRIVTLLRPF